MKITVTNTTVVEQHVSDGYWYCLEFSGVFNGVSIQPTSTTGVPLTTGPFTAPSRRGVFAHEEEIHYVITGGSAPDVTVTRRKMRQT